MALVYLGFVALGVIGMSMCPESYRGSFGLVWAIFSLLILPLVGLFFTDWA